MKTIVLVGRPNVGKSSLYNRLTKTRDAIVADMPGLNSEIDTTENFLLATMIIF